MKFSLKTQSSQFIGILSLVIIDLISKIITTGVHRGVVQSQINPVAARGISVPQNILIVITAAITALIARLWWKKQLGGRSSVMLLAGAIGNLYDRIFWGGVRDRISIGMFPVFNIADICITCGVIVFIYEQYRQSCAKH